jgi:GDP-L-fucose synthase
MSNLFENKKVLVTGGTGMIGMSLVKILLERQADVLIVSLDNLARVPKGVNIQCLDLRNFDNCLRVCDGIDFVFHLAGVKGSPDMTRKKPASFFVPTLMFNTNMLEAARMCEVKRFLYTSSIGVYAPAEIFYEDAVSSTFPSENDKFAGWAKRMAELQIEAYKIQYSLNNFAIVRPANVYGDFDNFDPDNAMVIPSLINRAHKENPLKVWGDGSAIRDFIHADDVAQGMLLVLEQMPDKAVNLGSGIGYSIKELVSLIANNLEDKPEIVWDISKPSGDKKRLMDISRAKALGFEPRISLEEGIKRTVVWYRELGQLIKGRYNVFTENK